MENQYREFFRGVFLRETFFKWMSSGKQYESRNSFFSCCALVDETQEKFEEVRLYFRESCIGKDKKKTKLIRLKLCTNEFFSENNNTKVVKV